MDPPTLFDLDGGALDEAVAAPATQPAPAEAAPAPLQPAPAGPVTRASRQPPPESLAPTLLAVDGDSLAHRAFHGYPADRTRGPVYGFLALLAALCDQVPVDGLVVGFDSRESSRRRERYPAYKGQRDDKDPGLVAVLLALPEGLADLGVSVSSPEGWEADDVVASAAAAAEAAGWRCAVATSDRDAYCLVTERTTVLRMRGAGEVTHVTPEVLGRNLRIRPEQYIEYAALRGDTSDNLPGVPGIGPARAAALLAVYPTVDEAAADPIGCRSVLGREVGQVLLDDLAAPDSVFRRNMELMSPRRELAIDMDAARRRPPAARIADCLDAWGLGVLAGRVSAALAARPDRPPLPDAPI